MRREPTFIVGEYEGPSLVHYRLPLRATILRPVDLFRFYCEQSGYVGSDDLCIRSQGHSDVFMLRFRDVRPSRRLTWSTFSPSCVFFR